MSIMMSIMMLIMIERIGCLRFLVINHWGLVAASLQLDAGSCGMPLCNLWLLRDTLAGKLLVSDLFSRTTRAGHTMTICRQLCRFGKAAWKDLPFFQLPIRPAFLCTLLAEGAWCCSAQGDACMAALQELVVMVVALVWSKVLLLFEGSGHSRGSWELLWKHPFWWFEYCELKKLIWFDWLFMAECNWMLDLSYWTDWLALKDNRTLQRWCF